MPDESDLHRRVKNDIQKTGYPTELQVREMIWKCGWHAWEHLYYLDRDEGKGREIDIVAGCLKIAVLNQTYLFAAHTCAVEVKKSNKPWVVFTSPRSELDPNVDNLINYRENVGLEILLEPTLLSGHHSNNFKRLGRSFYECFKGSSSNIFAAVLSAVKATEEISNNVGQIGYSPGARQAFEIDMPKRGIGTYSGLVIFDGNLFESYLGDKGHAILQKRDHILCVVNYLSMQYKYRTHLVDIVTIKGLKDFIEKQTAWVDIVLERVARSPMTGRRRSLRARFPLFRLGSS